jgi:O-antigen/teichoic acid export membrane protein
MATTAKYAKETFWAVASKAVAFVFYYALIYYLTRQMTVEVWGDWSGFLALLNVILLVSDQGINMAGKRYVAAARDTAELGGVVRATFILRVVASLLYVLLIALLLRPLLLWLHQPGYIGLMQRALLLVALYGIVEYFKSLFEALHRLRFTFVVTTLEHGLKFLLVLLLFRGGDDFVAIVTAFTIAVAVAVLGGMIQSLRAIPQILSSTVPPGLMRQVYLYSLPVLLTSIGGFISLEIDVIMLKSLRNNYETGIYSAAKQIVMFLPQISLTLSMATIPGLSVFDQENAQAQRKVYYRMLGGLAGVYFLVCLGLIVFAFWGIRIFFPPAYQAAWAPLLVLIPFVLFNAATIYSGNLMIYRGLAWRRSLNAALTIVANVFLNWWLIPIWGPLGSAAASSIAYLPYCILNLRAADKAFQKAT